MFFALITFLSAFLIEGIGTYISILGLSALFAFNPVIIAMAVALDIGKLVAVSFIYKNWQKVNWLMKSYMTIASIVLVLITSMGAFGFLSAEFQKAIAGNSQQNVLIEALVEEKGRLQARKDQIDKQIAELPATYSRGRVTVINGFKEETTRINARLAKIDEELPQLKVQNIEKSVKIGPILYVAEAFKTTPEIAVKWVILTIIFVFDPLAIALLLAGNFLLAQREQKNTLQRVADEVRDNPLPVFKAPPVTALAPADGPVLAVPGDATWTVPACDGTWTVPAEALYRSSAVMDDDPPTRGKTLSEQQPEASSPEQPAPVVEQAPFPRAAVEEVPQPRKTQQLTIEENPNGPDLVKRETPPETKFDLINGARADVSPEDDRRRIASTRELVNKYRSDIPAVTVGGPFKR